MTQVFYYREPRLSLTSAGEFFARLMSYSAYAVSALAGGLFVLSDLAYLRSLGVFTALFLLDRLLHMGQGEKTLAELKGERVNIAEATTPAVFRVVNYALRRSLALGEEFRLALLLELVERREIKESLRRLSVDPAVFAERVGKHLAVSAGTTGLNKKENLLLAETLMVSAYHVARDTDERFVEPRNLFAALTAVGGGSLASIFEFFNLSTEDVTEAIIFGRWAKRFSRIRRVPAVLGGFAHRPRFLRRRVMNRAWTARPTPTLDQFGTDLTDLARAEAVGLLVGHQVEFGRLLAAISRPGKPNALLVGAPGMGKSTIIAHLAFRIIKDEVPPALFDKRLVSLEIADLVANATPEVLSGRLQKIVEEILLAGNIVLVIDNAHNLFRTGDAKKLSAIDLLLPLVKNDVIPVIADTFPKEFKQYIEPRSDFLEQFEVIPVEEITEAEAARVLVYTSIILEREFKISITFRAVRKAVDLAHRYLRANPLPGSALDLLKQSLAKAHEEKAKILDESYVVAAAQMQTKVPIASAGVMETEKLLNLERTIHERLVNQDTAVGDVARALREYRSGLARKGGPIATFLFVGPTGVGKTELAKLLAQANFGSKERMHRFDMSEYQDKQSIFRLIGTPDGERTGSLTDAVLAEPYSLVLLDEFEKAHPDLLNLFLQVFDDGRLTDSLGRTANFENTIIIATSNAHSVFIKEQIEAGRTVPDIAEELEKKLTDYFKPELINRFSDIIVFRNLSMEEIRTVAGFLVKEVVDLLSDTHGVTLAVEESAIREITRLGYSPVFGARPLRQVISEKVKGVLAEKILRKELPRGSTVTFTFEGGEFRFSMKK
ncbi:MAG: ATP-dependent Clp protease ATP-binding subunit [Candidatus Jorgensenbacteria bacterium]